MIKILNGNRFYLKGTNNRFMHLATMTRGFNEYICFVDMHTSECYIEQITGGSLSFIDDDDLVRELKYYLDQAKILDATDGLPKPR